MSFASLDSPSKQTDSDRQQEKEKESSPAIIPEIKLQPSPLTMQTSAPFSSTAKQVSSSVTITSQVSPPSINSRSRISPTAGKQKVVISPIRIASSGESNSEESVSPKENGLPKQYRKNYNKSSGTTTNSRHRHRHSRRSSPERHRDRHRRDDSGRRRGYDRPKARRTEHDRYR